MRTCMIMPMQCLTSQFFRETAICGGGRGLWIDLQSLPIANGCPTCAARVRTPNVLRLPNPGCVFLRSILRDHI